MTFDALRQDVRYALRAMRGSPGFTAVAVLSLALGIGANTAVFSLIEAVMLRSLPVRDPHQLVELLSRFPGEPRHSTFWLRHYEHFRDHNQVFSQLIALSPARFRLTGDGFDAEAVDGVYVIGNFFSDLGLRPAIGRLIGQQDDAISDSAAAVVSWSFWHRRFNGDPAILGSRMLVDGAPATVVGVTPREFFGLVPGVNPDIWVPVSLESKTQRPSHRDDGTLTVGVMGRLKPGVSLAQARADMAVLNAWRVDDLARTRNAPFLRQMAIDVEPGAAGFSILREWFSTMLFVLMIVVGLLLAIACVNVAGMLLARGAARQREVAVRVSLGAGRLRLVRQVLTESLLLSGAGAALGVVFAYFGSDALMRLMLSGRPEPGAPLRFDIQVRPDLEVLLFAVGVALLTGVLFGMAPAWNAFRSAPISVLRHAGSVGETRSRRLFGKGLVVAQVALSVVLLSAAVLFVNHLSKLRNVDTGFRRDSVLLVTLDPSRSGYERNQLAALYQQLLGRMKLIPGVRAATLSAVTPIEGPGAARFVNVEGFQEKPEDRRYLSLNWIAPSYFETFGTPILAGRDFRFDDEGRPRVAIVNRAMAQYYFGDRDPIGRRFAFDGVDGSYEIVGVVADAKYRELRDPAPRTIYLNAIQERRGAFSKFALRTDVEPLSVADGVRRAVRDLLKTVPVAKMTTLADQMDASIVPERLIATLSGFFGAIGALLSALGLYGLLAYTVARRTSEIGVRMALGATERTVAAMVLKSALALVLGGLIVGLPAAALGRRIAATFVQNLTLDFAVPLAFAAAAMILVGLAAAYLPARRAARVNPTDALRQT